MDDFEPYLAAGLGRPDRPPPPPQAEVAVIEEAPRPPPPPAPEAVGFQLLGTITERDNCFAAFQTPEGFEIRRVGDTIGGAQVVEITEGAAVMRQPDGHSVTLHVPPPPQG